MMYVGLHDCYIQCVECMLYTECCIRVLWAALTQWVSYATHILSEKRWTKFNLQVCASTSFHYAYKITKLQFQFSKMILIIQTLLKLTHGTRVYFMISKWHGHLYCKQSDLSFLCLVRLAISCVIFGNKNPLINIA